MSRLKQILLATAMMAAAASDDRVYKQSNESGGMRFNPNYRPKPVHRELREFTVKGQKIMAYSKKDAVTKLIKRNRSWNNYQTIGRRYVKRFAPDRLMRYAGIRELVRHT